MCLPNVNMAIWKLKEVGQARLPSRYMDDEGGKHLNKRACPMKPNGTLQIQVMCDEVFEGPRKSHEDIPGFEVAIACWTSLQPGETSYVNLGVAAYLPENACLQILNKFDKKKRWVAHCRHKSGR